MIRELFLPDALFTQNIIGLEIGKNQILACQIFQKKDRTKVEKIVTTNIESSADKSYEEQIIVALEHTLNQFENQKNCILRLTIPNSQIFFKELTVPFLDRNKIKLILGYEIESNLPFSLSEAVFDFVFTKQDLIKKESLLTVAVAQKKQIDFYLDLINQAQTKLKISTITVDLIGTFNLYHLLEKNSLEKNNLSSRMLIDAGKTSITIVYLWENQPWLVRNLPYGINSIVSKIATSQKKSSKDVIEWLLRFGLEEHEGQNLNVFFEKLINDIKFTLRSFQTQIGVTPEQATNPEIFLVESAIEIKDFASSLTKNLNLECHNLLLNKLNTNHKLEIAAGVHIAPGSLPCLNAALIDLQNAEFNLLPINALSDKILRYQIITTFLLSAMILGSIYIIGFIKNQNLQNILNQYSTETVKKLKNEFNLNTSTLTEALAQANTKVDNESKLWFSFSNQTRYSTLKYLQVLSDAIDMKNLNLDIKKLIISDNNMTIQGAVEQYEDIYPFEQALTSVPIFKSVTKSLGKNFTINITLKQSDRELA
jgi:Tfp pilus assembly PilM family ATPase